MKWLRCLMLLGLLSGGIISPASALDYEEYPSIRLRSLDKVTARTLTFDAQVGSTIKFGDIYIKIQSCRKPPAIEKNEAAAFLQIWQIDRDTKMSHWVFSGWMFSSSPALSGMDHPVYDVWVMDCFGKDPDAMPVPAADPKDGQALPDEGTVPENSVVQPDVAPEEQKPVEHAPMEEQPLVEQQTPADTEVPAERDVAPVENAQPEEAPQKPSKENIEGIY